MTRLAVIISLGGFWILSSGQAQSLSTSGSTSNNNPATVPVPKLEQDSYDWYQRHADVMALKQTLHPQIILIGDSITHFWAGPPAAKTIHGPKAWEKAFHDLPVLNLGFGWDRTQNVLWRLDHGEMDGLHPRVVVINVGTNNTSTTSHARANTPEEIANGIVAVCDRIRRISPQSRLIVMGIFPRGEKPNTPLRDTIKATNQCLKSMLANYTNTTLLDIGSQFLEKDGSLPQSMMSDGTHPTEQGYEIWAKALLAAGVRD